MKFRCCNRLFIYKISKLHAKDKINRLFDMFDKIKFLHVKVFVVTVVRLTFTSDSHLNNVCMLSYTWFQISFFKQIELIKQWLDTTLYQDIQKGVMVNTHWKNYDFLVIAQTQHVIIFNFAIELVINYKSFRL